MQKNTWHCCHLVCSWVFANKQFWICSCSLVEEDGAASPPLAWRCLSSPSLGGGAAFFEKEHHPKGERRKTRTPPERERKRQRHPRREISDKYKEDWGETVPLQRMLVQQHYPKQHRPKGEEEGQSCTTPKEEGEKAAQPNSRSKPPQRGEAKEETTTTTQKKEQFCLCIWSVMTTDASWPRVECSATRDFRRTKRGVQHTNFKTRLTSNVGQLGPIRPLCLLLFPIF